mmetsp:Transcript_15809/g.45524  ORF Transcript_15809/g.45524 Transcript_15809/m.45524 type:complete len:89 (+) Transcript_15809:1974-2240(+)
MERVQYPTSFGSILKDFKLGFANSNHANQNESPYSSSRTKLYSSPMSSINSVHKGLALLLPSRSRLLNKSSFDASATNQVPFLISFSS